MGYMGMGSLPGQTGYGQQQPDWEKLFAMLKGPSPLMTAGMQAGGSVLGGLADLIGGDSFGEKKGKQLYGQLESMKGQPMMSPTSTMNRVQPYMQSGMIDFMNKLGVGASRRSGLDSGQGQGEILRNAAPAMGGQMGDMLMKILMMNAQAPLDISRLQAQLAAGLR